MSQIQPIITAEAIASKVAELGAQISKDYGGKDLLLLSVLKGSVVFLADIMRQITIPCAIDFMAVSSYGNSQTSSGAVKINLDLKQDIGGRHVLIIEDIVDSGLTLGYLIGLLKARTPASLEVCALLNKKARNEINIKPKYQGFDLPDAFVVGYGLDYAEKFRGLPYIGDLKEI
ncbi:MAG: hypoxanthine phosphoribosyltransferase [Oscillospiraceae bacterium]|jgi:hypoxanthine phosphoribosyltransferase|nr:hypoxanthine phosphoribosyltransferase [Oscillospiraceae bacterium]